MYNNVFISYAKEDFKFAKELYDFLKLNHYNPWLDKECLLPGQNWDLEINRALRKADFVILLISNTSIAKRGYVQREYKLALKYFEEKLEDDIYLLPLKLDNCDVPFGFEKFQWLELSEDFGFYKVLDSFNYQRKKLELQNNKYFNKESDFEYEEKKIIKEIGTNPKKNVEIYYPNFSNKSNDDILILNSEIESQVLSSYSDYIGPNYKTLFFNTEHHNQEIEMDWDLLIKYEFSVLNKDLVCLSLFTSMFTGGAHGNYWTSGCNYLLNPFMKITINDIFFKEKLVLEKLISFLKLKIEAYAYNMFGINDMDDFYLNPLQESWEEIDNFLITPIGLMFIFYTYQLTCYALGEHKLIVSYDELLDLFPDSKPLKYLKEKTTNINIV